MGTRHSHIAIGVVYSVQQMILMAGEGGGRGSLDSSMPIALFLCWLGLARPGSWLAIVDHAREIRG